MKVSFARGAWNPSDFEQITSLRTDGRIPFYQEDECVVNDQVQKEELTKHNYISLLSREYFEVPVQLETVCSFEKFGAPLLVFTDDVISAEDGYPAYGRHFEIVAYEEGFNIWRLNGKEKPILAGKGRFPVPEGEKLLLRAKITKDAILVELGGQITHVPMEDIPSRFRAGITACEGINRFYSFEAKAVE